MDKKCATYLLLLFVFSLGFFCPGVGLYGQEDDIIIIEDEEEGEGAGELGDEFVIEGEEAAEEEYTEEWEEEYEEEGEFEAGELAEEEEPLEYGEEVYRPGFSLSMTGFERAGRVLSERKEPRSDGFIVRAYDRRTVVSPGDTVVVVLRGADEVEVGDEYTTFRKGKLVTHPVTNKPVGYYIINTGYLRVSEKKEGRILATVRKAYTTIYVGDKLRDREVIKRELTESNVSPRMVTGGEVRGRLIWTECSYAGPQHLVCLDRGSDLNLVPGLILSVYSIPRELSSDRRGDEYKARFCIGEVEVVRVDRNTAVGRVTKARDGIKVGQLVVLSVE